MEKALDGPEPFKYLFSPVYQMRENQLELPRPHPFL
jgi:hypothetical protein